MATVREILGDNAIKALLDQGHDDLTIRDMALAAKRNKEALAPTQETPFIDAQGVNGAENIAQQSNNLANIYETNQLKLKTDPQYLADEKQRLADAKQLDNPLMRFFVGDGKSIMENTRGEMMAAEWAAKSKPTEYAKTLSKNNVPLDTAATLPSNFITPSFGADTQGNPTIDTTPKLATDVQYSKATQTLGKWIKEIDTKQQNYKSTIGDKWDVASNLGEMAGGFADFLNVVPINMETRVARTIGFSLTGMASGGFNALGGDRDVAVGMATGAIATPVIGETLHVLGTYGSKLLSKYYNNVPKDTPVDAFDFNTYADKVLKTYSPEVKNEVMTAVKTGGDMPAAVSKETADDLFRGYEIEKGFTWVKENEDALKSVDAKTQDLLQKVKQGENDSIVSSENMRRELLKMQKDGASANEIKRYINAKATPSEAELTVTRLINDGMDVEPRFSSYKVLHALEKSMELPQELRKTPEEMFSSLKKAGFNDEAATAFSDAYSKGDISLAQSYFHTKLQTKLTDEVMNSVEIRPYSPEIDAMIAKERAVNDMYDAQSQHLKAVGEEDVLKAKQTEEMQSGAEAKKGTDESTSMDAGQDRTNLEPKKTPTLDEMLDEVKFKDNGGTEQSELYKAQMQAWADAENVRLKEQGKEPNVTAEDMAKRHTLEYTPKDDALHVNEHLVDVDGNALFQTKKIQDDTLFHTSMGEINKLDNGKVFWTTPDLFYSKKYGKEGNRNTYSIRNAHGLKIADIAESELIRTINKQLPEGKRFHEESLFADNGQPSSVLLREPAFIEALKKHGFDGLQTAESYRGEPLSIGIFNNQHKLVLSKNSSGRGFEMIGTPKTKIDLATDMRAAAGISEKDIVADLVELLDKHKNYFKNDRDVYSHIIKLKENATHFLSGSNPNNVLLAKQFDDILRIIGVQKDGDAFNKVVHASISKKINEFKRLQKRNLEGSPTPSLIKTGADGANARSSSLLETPPDKISLNRGHDESIAQKLNQDIKGAYTIDKKLIQIFESHDVSTLNHELGHRFLFTLSDAEKAIAERIFGVENGKWNVDNHEAFANAYTRYIAEGQTPVNALKRIFEKFKQFSLDILDALRGNNGGKLPEMSEEMKTFFSATMGDVPSREKLFSKMKDDGILFQKGSDETLAKIEDNAMKVEAENKIEQSVKLHGGIAEPVLDMIFEPLKKLQAKAIDGFDALGKVKPNGSVMVKVERVSLDRFKKETGIDASKMTEAKVIDAGAEQYELSFDKNGRRELHRIETRNTYENSIGNTVKIGMFDNLKDTFKKMIHLKNAAEFVSQNRAYEHMQVLSKLSKEDQVQLGKALDGDKASLDAMSEPSKALYDTYRKLIDDGAELLIRYGFLDDKERITDYVRRLYLPYVVKQSVLDRFRNTLFDSNDGFANALGGIFRRKDMSLAERIEKGQIFDASYVIPITRMEQERLLIRGKFYDEIANRFASLEKIEGYWKIPNEPFKFGNLSGKYVPLQLYDAIVNAPEIRDGLIKVWQNLFSHIKVNKTVKMPFTHIYNIGSNVENMVLSHTSPVPFFRNVSNGRWEDVVALGEKYGMIDNDQLKNALGEIVSKIEYKEGDKSGAGAFADFFTRVGKEIYMAEGSTIGNSMRFAYGWEDKIFKLIAMQDNVYKLKLEKYKQTHGDLSLVDEISSFNKINEMKLDPDAEYLAFKGANELFADYQIPLPKYWRMLDDNIVPFLKYAVKSTPITIKLMMKNPMTALALNVAGGGYAARGAGIVAGVAGLEGAKEFFEGLYQDIENKAHESYMARSGTLFGVDLPDNLMGVDNWRAMGETDTHITYWNQGRMAPGIRGDALDSILTLGMIGQFIGYSTGVDLRTQRTFFKEDDPASVKVKNSLSKMVQDVSPGLLGTYGPKYVEAFMYGENVYGEPTDAIDVTAQGLGIRRVRKDRAEALKQKEITTKLNKYLHADERLVKARKEYDKFLQTKGAEGISKRKYDERVKTIKQEKDDTQKEIEDLKKLQEKVDGWSSRGRDSFGHSSKKSFSPVGKII